jgi:hypothetical protein
VADAFRPVRPEDVTDLALLPRRFDMFAAEVKAGFELLGNKLLPAMERVEHAITDLAARVTALEKAKHVADDIHEAMLKRIRALEIRVRKTRKVKR